MCLNPRIWNPLLSPSVSTNLQHLVAYRNRVVLNCSSVMASGTGHVTHMISFSNRRVRNTECSRAVWWRKLEVVDTGKLV